MNILQVRLIGPSLLRLLYEKQMIDKISYIQVKIFFMALHLPKENHAARMIYLAFESSKITTAG